MRRSLQLAALAIYGAILLWALWRFGGTEDWELYRLFLLSLVPTLLVVWTLPRQLMRDWRLLPLLLVGAFLLAQILLRPTLEGRGYVLAALAWMALFLGFGLVSANHSSARGLLFLLLALGSFEALYGLSQTAGPEATADGLAHGLTANGLTGTFVNRNHFAGLLNMILALASGVLIAGFSHSKRSARSETWAWTWVVLLSGALMGGAVLLSLSRGGVLSLVLTLAFMTSLLTLRRTTSPKGRWLGLAPGLLLLAILGLASMVGLGALGERFALLDEDRSERVQVYADSLRLVRDHAIFGVGPGMYRWRFRAYQQADADRRYDHAHNDYLEIAADWGVPVALGIWGFIGWRFYRACRRAVRSSSPLDRGLALGCAGAMLSILLHSLVDFNLQIPSNLMVFWLIVGLAWSLEVSLSQSPAHRGVAPSSRPAALAALGRR